MIRHALRLDAMRACAVPGDMAFSKCVSSVSSCRRYEENGIAVAHRPRRAQAAKQLFLSLLVIDNPTALPFGDRLSPLRTFYCSLARSSALLLAYSGFRCTLSHRPSSPSDRLDPRRLHVTQRYLFTPNTLSTLTARCQAPRTLR